MKTLQEYMLKKSYEVEVIINGKPAREYMHKGKLYIEGRKGTRFSIKIRNNSFNRKLFVPTIDGLSIMNGEEGKFDSGGYIVNGYSSITIEGWRTSDKEVASFYFSSPEGSYRKRMKKGNNLGIIGVAVFDEKPILASYYQTTTSEFPSSKTWPPSNLSPCIFDLNTRCNNIGGSSSFLCSAVSGSAPQQNLGTGWGEQKTSEVTSVNFDREKSPDAVFEINYNTREELIKTGVNFKKEPLYVAPQAFPGQYCKPPQN